MKDYKKTSQVAVSTSEVKLENDLLIGNILDELIRKLKEARELSSQLASISIVVKDQTNKELDEYIKELRNDFIKKFGIVPQRISLQAEAETYVLQLSLA